MLCRGDIVGYGPNPAEAIDLVRDLNATCIRGNHDRVASGLDEATNFNMHARQAIHWTREALPDSYREYLAAMLVGPLEIMDDSQLVHGAITDEDDYVFTEAEANMNLLLTRKTIRLSGTATFRSCLLRTHPAGQRSLQCTSSMSSPLRNAIPISKSS